MTTLVGIQGDGWTVIGADSQASDDSGFTMEIVTGKIFKNGPAIIAGAGSVRGINLLQYGWKAPAIGTASPEVYMTKSFIPSMRAYFIESGYDIKQDSEAAENDNEFLVSIKGILYNVADDYSWERCSRRLFIGGSGGKYALGALAVLEAQKSKTPEAAEKFIRKAIAVAIQYDAFSGGKIDTIVQEA